VLIRFVLVALTGVLLAAPALAGEHVRVALLPIAVHASGTESDYLQTGLAEMLSARLEQYDGLEVVRPGEGGTPTPSRDEVRSRGREVGADFVLYGSFTRFGKGASLDLRCEQLLVPPPAEGQEDEPVAAPARQVFIQAGTLAEIIPDLDTLAEKVARFAISAPVKTPTLAGAGAAGQAQAPAGPSAAEYRELLRRLDALERATFTPVAQGEPAADDADADAAASLVR